MKKILKKIHLYLALALCIPLILQGLAGAILVFQHQISDSFLQKDHVFSTGEIADADTIIKSAGQNLSEDFSPIMIKIPSENDAPASVRFSAKGKKREMREVLIDKVSLQVIEVKNPDQTFFRLIRKFHDSLFISGQLGKNIVGFFGLTLLLMSVTGLILWWPKKGNLFRALTFKISSKGKKFYRDLHGAIGFWLAVPLIIVSLAGVYLSYTPQATRAVLFLFDGKDLRKTADKIKVEITETPISLNEAINLATSGVSTDDKFLSAAIPNKPNQPFRINFAPQDYRAGEPQITVFVDQYKKEIIEIRHPDSYTFAETLLSWQHAIHDGDAWGLHWRIIVFIIGFLPLFLAFTGIALWLQKKNKKYPNFG